MTLGDLLDLLLSDDDEDDEVVDEVPEPKPMPKRHDHDPIREACARFCDAHNCQTCDIHKNLAVKRDGFCVVGLLAGVTQPVESAISKAMEWARHEDDSRPTTYLAKFFADNPDATIVQMGGRVIPPVCRVEVYGEHGDRCPGGKPCWECWREEM